MKGKVWAVAMTGLVMTGAISGAKAAPELLGQPCRAKNVLASIVVKDPNDGKNYLVLTNMNETTGAELLFVDYKNDTGRVVRAPAGSGSWALNEVPGNRLVVGTYYDGAFMVYDLKAREWIKSVKFPGESYIWNLAMGKDGRIYGGSYPGGKLGALDLTTYEVEDCGAPAKPNMYLRYVSPMPDGRIFCQFGMDKNQTKIYDPAAKAWTDAPDYLQDVTQAILWNGYFIFVDRVYEGNDLKPVTDLPFPLPKGVKKWNVSIPLSSPETLYFYADGALYRYRKGDREATRVTRQNLKGGAFTAASDEGDVLARRGQDYGWLKPGASKVTLRPYPVESGPRPTHFLAVAPDGKVWGGPPFGQTVFWLDPATKEYGNTRTVSDNGGEVYDATFRGDTMYMAAYAGGEVIRYDTKKDFDQFNRKNPRTIARVGPDYIRPSGGIVLGPDGKLYSGWMAKYGEYGGALAITDPDSGKNTVIKNPLGPLALGGVAVDDARIYIGSSIGANGLRDKPDTIPEFGVLDRATHKMLFRTPMRGAGSVHDLVYDLAARRVAMIAGQRVALFDVASMAVMELAETAPKVTSSDGSGGGDGFYYYGSGNSLVGVDIRTAKASVVAELPANIDHVGAGKDGAVYVACGADVYRARAAGPPAAEK